MFVIEMKTYLSSLEKTRGSSFVFLEYFAFQFSEVLAEEMPLMVRLA